MKEIVMYIKGIFTKKERWKFVGLFFIMTGVALFELFGISIILPFINEIMNLENNTSSYFSIIIEKIRVLIPALNSITIQAIALAVVYIIKTSYLLLAYYIQYRLIYNMQVDVSVRLLKKLVNKPYSFHIQRNSAESVRSVTDDITRLFDMILAISYLISEIMISMLLVVYLVYTDSTITISVLALLSIILIIYYSIFRNKLIRYGKERQYQSGQMIKHVNQAIGGIKEIKVNETEEYFVNRYKKSSIKFAEVGKKYGILGAFPKNIIELVCILGMLFVIILKNQSGIGMVDLIPKLAVFAMAAFRLLPSVNRINTYVNQVLFHKASLKIVYDGMEEKEEEYISYNKICNNLNTSSKEKEIFLDNISFRYSKQEKYILKNVVLKIKKSDYVGLIGSSGGGKTTLCDIILGLLLPEEGSIFYNGEDIQKDLHKWHKQIGYIPQNIYLIDDTIENNILFGSSQEIDEKKLLKIIEQAQLKDLIDELKYGLQTVIGEQGIRLSGGQRQRIGIARALYKNPEILIFDEATSALDNETEKMIIKTIESLSKEKTLIIIAHRLSTIKNCNCFYKVENKGVSLINEI